jgi:hypothetical protein
MQKLSLHGPNWGPRLRGEALYLARVTSRSENDGITGDRSTILGQHAIDAVTDNLDARHPSPIERHSGSVARFHQSCDQRAVVYLMIARCKDAPSDRGGQSRFEATTLLRRESLGLQTKPAVEREELIKRGVVVQVAGHDDRPAGTEAGRATRSFFEIGYELLVTMSRFKIQSEERLLAIVDLGDGSKEARRDPRCSSSHVIVDNRHGRPTLSAPPRDAEADDSPADDEDVWSLDLFLPTPALSGSGFGRA